MKRFMKIGFRILLLSGLVALALFARRQARNMPCKEVVVELDFQGGEPLIDKQTVENDIIRHFDSLQGVAMKDLPLETLEAYLNDIPEVAKAEVYTTISGRLGMRIALRRPVALVFTKNNRIFYLGSEGVFYQPEYEIHPHILVVNGDIPPNIEDEAFANLRGDISKIVNAVEKDRFLSSLVEELARNSNGEYELVPKIGKQIILLGKTCRLPEKLEKLKLFYAQGLKAADGWNTYKVINLKFDNQVVCTK